MKKNYITRDTQINTMAGYIIAEDYNGSIVECSEYIVNEDGSLEETDGRRLTLNEIGHLMKEVDGQNHKVFWIDPEDIEED